MLDPRHTETQIERVVEVEETDDTRPSKKKMKNVRGKHARTHAVVGRTEATATGQEKSAFATYTRTKQKKTARDGEEKTRFYVHGRESSAPPTGDDDDGPPPTTTTRHQDGGGGDDDVTR